MLSVASFYFGVVSIDVNMGKDGDTGGTLCVDCGTWALEYLLFSLGGMAVIVCCRLFATLKVGCDTGRACCGTCLLVTFERVSVGF